MNLLELLIDSGAGDSLRELGSSIGIGGDETKSLVAALGPAIAQGLQQQAVSGGGVEALQRALETGGHQQYIEQPDLMQAEDTRADGNRILGHLFGSKDVSRNVAAQAASDTGLDPATIKQALPLVAGLAMGALKNTTQQNPEQGSREGLGRLLGGMLSKDSGGGDLGNLLGMAKKLF